MTDRSRHCSFEGRAWTDMLSNATSIAPDDATDDPRPWLRDLPGGADHVGAFVHEFTHHWCFDSVVGAAVSTVARRAELTSFALLLSRSARTDDDLDLLRQLVEAMIGHPRDGLCGQDESRLRAALAGDVLRIETTLAMLRPIAEGLALFAEFDAVSRILSDAWSPLPPVLATYFAGLADERHRSMPQPAGIMYSAGDVLRAYRLLPETVEKKADLLTGALATEYDGGYLAGYLSVKNMWRHLCGKQQRLRGETDLVLAFLRSYFYDDPLLTELILRPAELEAGVLAVANRVKQLLDDFRDVRDVDVDAFEQRLVQGTGRRPGPPGEVHSDCTDRIAVEIDRLHADPLAVLTDDLPRRIVRRTYITVSSVPVVVEHAVDGNHRVTWSGELLDGIRAEHWLVEPETETAHGRLEVVATLTGNRFFDRAAVVTLENEPIACRAYGIPGKSDHGDVRAEVLSAYRTREMMVTGSKAFRELPEWMIEDDVVAHIHVQHVRDHLNGIVDSVFQDTALWFATDGASIDRCAELMAEDGMAGVGLSTRDVMGLSLAGLAISLNGSEDFVRAQFDAHSLDLTGTVEAVARSRADCGFPTPIVLDEHGCYFSLV